MKKTLLFFIVLILNTACGVKHTRTLLTSGNYDEAIDNSISNLKSNKEKKSKQDYVYILEEAFAKVVERDNNTLNLLTQDSNPANLEKIYNTYLALNNRQEKIKPLLPLKFLGQNKNATFIFSNYNNQIIDSKNALSQYLYANSKKLLSSTNKLDYRKAYDDLIYLNQINSSYKDALKLIQEAQFKGTDFVSVYLKNQTNMVIPIGLENDLLNISLQGFNDKWTVFHSKEQVGIHYDYELILNFREIAITPEQVKEKEFYKERQIKDGTKTLVDSNGKTVKDSTGKPILVDNLKTVKASVYEFNQFKACKITAVVDYVQAKTNQLLDSFPISSEYVFENSRFLYKKNKSAVNNDYYSYFDRRNLAFPTNEELIYKTADDLKKKLKVILTTNKFKN